MPAVFGHLGLGLGPGDCGGEGCSAEAESDEDRGEVHDEGGGSQVCGLDV